jgi:hypothetical protein
VTSISTFLRIVWVASATLQVGILALIVFHHHYRWLPRFAWFIGLNLSQSLVMLVIYNRFGFNSEIAFRVFWATQVIIMVVQTLASIELLHRALQDYPGIWELAWRLILVALLGVLAYSWATATPGGNWGLWAADRGFNLTFAIAIIACLLLVRHYTISIDPVYKAMLGGFCFNACGAIVADTLLRAQVQVHFRAYAEVWNEMEMLIFFVVLVVWVVALRHPVRVPAQTPGGAGGVAAYEEFAPQVNARLRELNDTLRKFFRKQATQP